MHAYFKSETTTGTKSGAQQKMRNLDDHLIFLFLGCFEPALAAASFILDQG